MSPSDDGAMPAPAPLAFEPARVMSSAHQVGCLDDCSICAPQWRGPHAITLDDTQSQTTLARVLHESSAVHARNSNVLDKHGDLVLKLWNSTTVTQRKALVKSAHPAIHDGRGFPVATYLTEEMKSDPVNHAQKHRPTFLAPFITLGNVCDGKENLIALIQHHTECSPADWASFHYEQHHLPFMTGYLRAAYNTHCVVMYGENYGSLVEWNAKDAHALKIVSFSRFHLAAESELEVLRFIESIVGRILLLAPTPRREGGRQNWDALITKGALPQDGFLNPAFSPPPAFDITNVLELLRPRHEAIQDEHRLVQSESDALRQVLAKAQSMPDAAFGTKQDKEAYLVHLAMLPTERNDTWDYLMMEVELAAKELQRPSAEGSSVSREYDAALAMLEHVLDQQFTIERVHLKIALEVCSDFAKTLKAMQRQSPDSAGRIGLYSVDELLFHLIALAHHTQPTAEPMSWHLREIHTLPEGQLKRLNQLTFDLMSDLMALVEALTMVRSHRPRCSSLAQVLGLQTAAPPARGVKQIASGLREGTQGFSMTNYAREFNERRSRLHPISIYNVVDSKEKLSMLQAPVTKYLNMPNSIGQVSQKGIETVDKSHAARDAFYSKVREWRTSLLRRLGATEVQIVEHLKCVSVSLTLEHQKRVQAERDALVLAVQKEAPPAAILRELDPNAGRQLRDQVNVDDATGKAKPEKVKRRGVAVQQQIDDDVANGLEDLALNEAPPIEVTKNTLITLERLFDPSPQNRSKLGWQEFEAAMGDIGYQWTPNGGSAVPFKGGEGLGTIVVHRPHGTKPSLSHERCKDIAGRLRRKYGWTVETFVERTKAA
ncbi:unnamed protein product [Zymoseptoria tritici ST99CH_3D1]|nr:unnamed protein product [Zymoseptoria tritici ST99CH_3D1]